MIVKITKFTQLQYHTSTACWKQLLQLKACLRLNTLVYRSWPIYSCLFLNFLKNSSEGMEWCKSPQ